jgi:hypothetical protein
MLHVIDLMSVSAADMVFVIKEHTSGKIYWTGTLQDFVREMTAFFSLYMTEVIRIDTDSCRGKRLLFVYV